MKLYDMDTQEWREGGFQRGDSFRSKQVYVCQICRTKTNALFCGGYPGWGVRKICPGDSFPEHDAIEEALRRQDEIIAKCEQLGPYIEDAARVDSTARELERMWHAEGLILQMKIDALRQKFAVILDDVVGIAEITPDMLCEYWPGARVFGEKKSIEERAMVTSPLLSGEDTGEGVSKG